MRDTESAREDFCTVEPLREKALPSVAQAANGGPLSARFGVSHLGHPVSARDRAVLSRKGAGTGEDFGYCNRSAPAMVASAGKTPAIGTRTPWL